MLLSPFQAVFQFVPDPLPPLGRTYQLAADTALTQIKQPKMTPAKYPKINLRLIIFPPFLLCFSCYFANRAIFMPFL
jgi:hypothetical protein